MNKNGQFYLFTAVVLCTYLFALANVFVQKMETTDNFQTIKENFVKEGPIVINSAIYNNSNISEQFEDFKNRFVIYTKTKGVDLQLLYLLVNDEDIEIHNYLNDAVTINNNLTINPGQNSAMDKVDQIIVEVNGIEYEFDIGAEDLQFKALLKTVDKGNIKVHIYG